MISDATKPPEVRGPRVLLMFAVVRGAGEGMTAVGFPILVAGAYGAAATGLFVTAYFVFRMVAAGAVGQWLTSRRVGWLLAGAEWLRVLLVLSLLALMWGWRAPLWVMTSYAALLAGVEAVSHVCYTSVRKVVVPRDRLSQFISAQATLSQLANTVIAATLTTILLGRFSPLVFLAALSVSFCVTALLALFSAHVSLADAHQAATQDAASSRFGLLLPMRHGAVALGCAAVLGLSVVNGLFSGFGPSMPLSYEDGGFISQTAAFITKKSSAFGIILLALYVGGLSGYALNTMLYKRFAAGSARIGLSLMFGAASVPFYLSQDPTTVLLSAVMWGFATAILATQFSAQAQIDCPPALIGRLAALLDIVNMGGLALGAAVVTGFLTFLPHHAPAAIAAGCGVIAVTLVHTSWPRKPLAT